MSNPFGFEQAIAYVKEGKIVARSGWNWKGLYVYLNKGSASPEVYNSSFTHIGGVSKDLFDLGDDGTITRMPNLNMKAADGSTVTGWLASQTDLLAEDWQIVN